MIKDTSLKEVIEYKKYKDIYKLNSLEVLISLISALAFTSILFFIINNSNYEDINNLIRALTKDIAISLIGLLGFIVAALAILTSAISKKVMNIIQKKNKLDIIKRILLSFYLLGLIIGITIVIGFLLYLISFISVDINIKLFVVVTFIMTYLVVFILFYSIGLIGNCVQIFSIINISDNINVNLSKENRILFDSFRISALERVLFISDNLNNKEKINEYKKTMNTLINSVENIEQRNILIEYMKFLLGE